MGSIASGAQAGDPLAKSKEVCWVKAASGSFSEDNFHPPKSSFSTHFQSTLRRLTATYSPHRQKITDRTFSISANNHRNNRKGGTASLRSRTCVKRNAVFGAHFKGLSLYFYIKKESDTYQNGLGYISDTYPNPYPLVTVPPL